MKLSNQVSGCHLFSHPANPSVFITEDPFLLLIVPKGVGRNLTITGESEKFEGCTVTTPTSS